jgi:hypothetical protein
VYLLLRTHIFVDHFFHVSKRECWVYWLRQRRSRCQAKSLLVLLLLLFFSYSLYNVKDTEQVRAASSENYTTIENSGAHISTRAATQCLSGCISINANLLRVAGIQAAF